MASTASAARTWMTVLSAAGDGYADSHRGRHTLRPRLDAGYHPYPSTLDKPPYLPARPTLPIAAAELSTSSLLAKAGTRSPERQLRHSHGPVVGFGSDKDSR